MQIIQSRKIWMEKECDFVKDNYLNMTDAEIGEKLGRSPASIKNARLKFGLYRPRNQSTKQSVEYRYGQREKLSFEDVKRLFEERGYILLSTEDEYVNQSSKMRYICPKHKEYGEQTISVYHLKNGQGCYYCGRERTNAAHKSKITIEQDKYLCNLKGFEYIKTEIINSRAYIYFICKKHRLLGIQKMQRGNMNREVVKGCQYCANKNLPHWYVKYVIESSYPHITVLSEYEGMNKNITCFCSKHNITFTALAKDIFYNGSGCKECGREKISDKLRLSIEEVEKRIFAKNQNIEILNLNDYKDFETIMKFKCKKCGSVWETPFHSFIVNSGRCPICEKGSWGEQKISNLLLNNNIYFIPQYKYDDCVGEKRTLPFDFAILDSMDNVLGLIEYQGEQHYKPIKYFGGEEKFKQRIKYDGIKKEYCAKNNIPLLIIPYWNFNDIDVLVTTFLNNIK